MTGLILKDFYTMKKTLIYLAVLMVLFTCIYSTMMDSHFADVFLSVMVVSVLISTMSYDEFYHWDRYAAILPVSRRKIAGAKYLIALAIFGVGGLFSVGVGAGAQLLQGKGYSPDDLSQTAVALLVGMIGAAVVLPCYYRFGVQKSRFVLLGFYGIPSLLLVASLKFTPGFWNDVPKADISPAGVALGALALAAAAMGVSFLLSVRILERKELK